MLGPFEERGQCGGAGVEAAEGLICPHVPPLPEKWLNEELEPESEKLASK